jgi:3'-phosphoadenosine 5'-phosphosulfate sulfotransferase (PAPS reductase)/FAD synthetase
MCAQYYALVSGGKDSLALAHWLASRGELKACVFLDTGIRAPDLVDFLKTLPYPLEIYHTPASYEDLVKRYGFPRPYSHTLFMNYLKGRALRQFKKAHEGEQVVLASGARKGESRRRQYNMTMVNMTSWEGIPIASPLADWPTEAVWDYIKKHHIRLSPCYQALHYSGDCFCGAFAQSGELRLIRMLYPEVASRIRGLEKEVGGAWGSPRLPRARPSNQLSLDGFLCNECLPR